MEKEEIYNKSTIKYQNINAILTFILLVTLILILYISNLNYLNFISIPLFYIIIFTEHHYGYIQKKNIEVLYFILTIVSLGYISFFIIPNSIFIIIKILIFTISIYFSLEIFKQINLFLDEKVIIWQNLLSVIAFFLISYSIYPAIIAEDVLKILNPDELLITRILIFLIFFFFTLLISLYRLNSTFFKNKSSKIIKSAIITNFLVLNLVFVLFLDFRTFNIIDRNYFISFSLFSAVIFIVMFILFVYINFIFKVLKEITVIFYRSIWILFPLIITTSAITFCIPLIISEKIDTLLITLIILMHTFILSCSIQILLRYGNKIGKISQKRYNEFGKMTLISISIEICIITFLLSYIVLQLDLIISLFLSSLVLVAIVAILNRYYKKLLEKYEIITFSINLLYLISIIFYYSLFFTLNSAYVYIVPGILTSFFFSFFILYLIFKNIRAKFLKKLLKCDYIILSLFIILIPTAESIELIHLGVYVDHITTLNLTIYIFYIMLFVIHLISRKKELKPKKLLLKSEIIIGFILAGTTIFYYLFLIIPGQYIRIIVPLIISLCYVYMLLLITHKEEIFNNQLIQILIVLDMLILIGLSVSLPSFINLELEFWDSLGVINTINCSLYIFLIELFIFYFLSKKRLSGKFSSPIQKLIIFICYILAGSTIFYYLFSIIPGEYIRIIVPLTISLCYLYILLIITHKKDIFNKQAIQILIVLDMLILIGLIVSLPTFIGLELEIKDSLGFINTTNFSLYILFSVLFIFYLISKKRLSEKFSSRLKKVQMIICYILGGTTVFYYLSYIIPGQYIRIILPLTITFSYLYLLLLFSHKKAIFNKELVQKFILLDILVLICSIILIPTFIQLELTTINNAVDVKYIFIFSLLLLFLFLKFAEFTSDKLNLRSIILSYIKIALILSWFLICLSGEFIIYNYFDIQLLLDSYLIGILISSISIISFLIFSSYVIKLVKNLGKFYNFIEKIQLSERTFRVQKALKLVYIYGILVSISLILSSSILYISLIFEDMIILEIFNLIIFSSFFFILLHPLFILYKDNVNLPQINQMIKKFSPIFLIIVIEIIYSEIFWILLSYDIIQILLYFSSIVLITFLYIINKSKLINSKFLKIYFSLFIEIILICLSIIYNDLEYFIVGFIVLYLLISLERPDDMRYKAILYLSVSIIGFLKIIEVLERADILESILELPLSIFMIIYLMNFSVILLISMSLNYKKQNYIEKYMLFGFTAGSLFFYILSFTPILLIYDITISSMVLLFFVIVDFYLNENPVYKAFLRPWFVLLFFNLTSWISYSFLFIDPNYDIYNIILTFTLTFSITSLSFVLLNNNLPDKLRKPTYIISLIIVCLMTPIFIYMLLISYFGLFAGDVIMIIILLNIMILLFYFSIGIYHWQISWVIWKIGWKIWFSVPLINFYLIYKNVVGLDLFTEAVNLFGYFRIEGSLIITIIICSLMYLPVLYSAIRKYFTIIIMAVWGESLALTLWAGQNLFKDDLILSNLFFGLASLFLLAPILLKKRYWKVLSLLWLLLIILNIGFLTFLLYSMNLTTELVISIDIIALGIFLMVYSFFPKVRNYLVFLIISYSIIFGGIYLLIYFILFYLISDPILSFNIASLFISGALLSSKYFQLNQKLIRGLISILVLSNLSCLTYIYLNMFPNMEILSIASALTTGLISLLIFNHFNYILRSIDFAFLWILLGCSISFLSTSALYLLIPKNIFLISAISCFIGFLFIQRIMKDIKYLLIYLYPIPLSFLFLSTYDYFQIFNIFIVILFLLIYLISLQILITIFYQLSIKERENPNGPIYKYVENLSKVKLIHLLCFTFNSLYISLLISLFCLNIFYYQIISFFIIYPILNILILYYLKINSEYFSFKGIQSLLKIFGSLFFSTIPFSVSSLVTYFFMEINFPLIYTIPLIFIIFNGILFLELNLNNYAIKFFIGNTNKYFILLSIFFLTNSIAVLFLISLLSFSNLEILSLCLMFLISLLGLNLLSLNISERFLSQQNVIFNKFHNLLSILSYILIIGVFSSFLSEGTLFFLSDLKFMEFSYYLLFICYYAIVLYFILSIIKIIKEEKLYLIASISYSIFQITLTLNIINYGIVYENISLILINSIVFLNLVLSYLSIILLNIFNIKFNYNYISNKLQRFLSNIIYVYVNVLLFSILFCYFNIYISLCASIGMYIIIIIVDIIFFKQISNNKGLLLLIPLIIFFSITLILVLYQYFIFPIVYFKLSFLCLVSIQFITNYLYLIYKILKIRNNTIDSKIKLSYIENWDKRRKMIIGICLYISLIIFIQDLIGLLEISYQLFIIGIIIFSLSFIDDFTFDFLYGVKEYVKVISWIIIMITSNSFIFTVVPIVIFQSFIIRIPIFILIIDLELIFLLYILQHWNYFKKNKHSFMLFFYQILSFDIASFPLFYLNVDPILDLNLLILSLIIIVSLLNAIRIIKDYKNDKIDKINRSLLFTLINLICIDLFILFEVFLSPEYIIFNIYLNINIALILLLILYAIFFKIFTQKLLKSRFIFWLLISIFIGTIIFQTTYYFNYFPFISSFSFMIFSIFLFPFIFLMEKLKEIFNNFVEKIKEFIILIENKFVNLYKNIISFLKHNWIIIWSIISVFTGIIIFLLLGLFIVQYWVYSFIICIGLVFFMIFYNISIKSSEDNPGKLLKYRIIYLSSGWLSIIGIILSYIEAEFYIITVLLSFTILGAIFLPYIYYKEKKEKISIKWRFYSTIFFIIILIITIALFYFQFMSNYF
ncbi:MAG: hypothetical protein JXA99_05690 [Candidatus Lokiarchaeota archaeon]|nr:hypothetical protein [Candidatus Lokiarchaeota archaeon]